MEACTSIQLRVTSQSRLSFRPFEEQFVCSVHPVIFVKLNFLLLFIASVVNLLLTAKKKQKKTALQLIDFRISAVKANIFQIVPL